MLLLMATVGTSPPESVLQRSLQAYVAQVFEPAGRGHCGALKDRMNIRRPTEGSEEEACPLDFPKVSRMTLRGAIGPVTVHDRSGGRCGIGR
jgi:hypothetical protein